MEQIFSTINIQSSGQGLTDITLKIKNFVIENNLKSGLVVLNIMHTSCSLIVNENADPNVLKDLEKYINSLVPFNSYHDLTSQRKKISYKHYQEGEDDMPAHIKTALTNTSLSFSIQNEKLVLGTWQGIYLWEHRFGNNLRKINIHAIGEIKKNIYNREKNTFY
tara:strand:+ start:126 stop:617 length:492 start_codon:yes stop_codon:yes gene_type:complete